VFRRLGARGALGNPAVALGLGVVALMVVVLLATLGVTVGAELLQTQCAGQSGGVSISAPTAYVQTMGEMTGYLESQSIPAADAAGIVGNLMQESALNPSYANPTKGYGMAQWSAGWWRTASAWISSEHQNPFSTGGQLMYIAANVTQGLDAGRFSEYAGLSSDLAAATTPQQAAIVWMNDYEQCSGAGAPGSLGFTPNSLCEADQREAYALQAYHAADGAQGGSSQLVSLNQSPGCTGGTGLLTGRIDGYTNPFEQATGIVWERTDEGVDASMSPGSPLLALAPSKVIALVPFYAGQPAIVCEITAGPLAGKWWYLGEQISPSVVPGQTVTAGQTVATYAPTGTGIEIGWWTPDGGYPLAHAVYAEGNATPAGAAFRYLLQALGAKPGSGAGLSRGTTIGTTYYPPGP